MVGRGHVLRFGLDQRARPSEPALEVGAGAACRTRRAWPDSTSIAPLSPVTSTVMSFGLPSIAPGDAHHARELASRAVAARISRTRRAPSADDESALGGVQRADERDTPVSATTQSDDGEPTASSASRQRAHRHEAS